jgi:hypothetical protein
MESCAALVEPFFPNSFRIWATKSFFANRTSHHNSHPLTTDQGKFNQKSKTSTISSIVIIAQSLPKYEIDKISRSVSWEWDEMALFRNGQRRPSFN